MSTPLHFVLYSHSTTAVLAGGLVTDPHDDLPLVLDPLGYFFDLPFNRRETHLSDPYDASACFRRSGKLALSNVPRSL